MENNEDIKKDVHSFWNAQSCGIQFTDKEKYFAIVDS
jgi:hypothetical protein